MIKKYNNVSLLVGIPGMLLQIGGRVMAETLGPIGIPVILLGTAMLMVGLAYYAKAKGRHPAWCLMAFLSLIGLIVLACLKDLAAEEGDQ